jgi:hypothetical protein
MIRFAAFLLLLASTCLPPASTCAAHGIAPVPSTHKLTAAAPGVLNAFPVRPANLRAARGEWESFQIVVRADKRGIKNLKLRATLLATHLGRFLGRDNVQVFREHFTFVAKPSGNRELKPMWWSDALIPTAPADTLACEPYKAVAFWVAIRAPEDAEPGEYYGAIDFDIDGAERTLAVILNVEAAKMPSPTMRGTVAVYYEVLRDWYKKSGREFSDADWAAQKKRYYDFLLGYRINAYDLPVDWSDPAAGKYLRDPRVHSVRVPPLDSPELKGALQVLLSSGQKKKAFYYRIDEPTPEAYPQVLAATKELRKIGVPHLVTIHPNEPLKDAVDIWCPNIGDATGVGWIDFERLAAERKKGRETWWYTMVEPKFPFPTWLLDDDALAVRSYGWLMARHNITGFVYSMAHGWGPEPLKNLQSFADTWGDGTLLYPGEIVGHTGPIPSIRLMLLRDAIEDYELLKMLPEESRKGITSLNIAGGMVKQPEQPIRGIGTNEQPREVVEREPNDDEELEGVAGGNDPDVQRELIFEALKTGGDFSMADFWLPTQRESSVLVRAAPAPRLDGSIADAAWNSGSRAGPRNGYFARFLDDPLEWPQDAFLLSRDSKYLYAALRLRNSTLVREEQWCALEVAPRDGREKWRFVLTFKNSRVVERYTRQGRFRVENVDWKAVRGLHSGYTDIEFAIPLSLIGADLWRVNALRRVMHLSGAKVTLRAENDAGDARLMPLFRLRSQLPAASSHKSRQDR